VAAARRQAPGDDIGALIAFPKRVDKEAPAIPALHESDRLAAPAQRRDGIPFLALLAGSLVIHAAAFVASLRPPHPAAGIGIRAITVDIVFGADAPAGIAAASSREAVDQEQTPKPVQPDAAAPVGQAVKSAAVSEVAVNDAVPVAPDTVAKAEANPAAARPLDETGPVVTADAMPVAPDTTVKAEATPAAAKLLDEARPVVTAVPPQQSKPVAAVEPHVVRAQPTPSQRSRAASGVGRGRSDLDTNYPGEVAAHLARYKRYPIEAKRRGVRGSAGVSFAVDGHGAVTSVALTQSSGHPSLDHEAEAMVWRASPFPPPPDREPRRFSVPVSFAIR